MRGSISPQRGQGARPGTPRTTHTVDVRFNDFLAIAIELIRRNLTSMSLFCTFWMRNQRFDVEGIPQPDRWEGNLISVLLRIFIQRPNMKSRVRDTANNLRKVIWF